MVLGPRSHLAGTKVAEGGVQMWRPRQADALGWEQVESLTFPILWVGAALQIAVVQEPHGHDVRRHVDPGANVCRPALVETAPGEAQPTLGEDHDQQQDKGSQAEL